MKLSKRLNITSKEQCYIFIDNRRNIYQNYSPWILSQYPGEGERINREPKRKTDLEIFEQNDYIDLENIKNEKGIWELYNEN